jgi:Flp pilus assembly protein TadD
MQVSFLQAESPVTAQHPPAADLLHGALAHHQAGRFQQAEAAYREILAIEPAHADTLHLLGVLAHQVGRNDLAVQYIGAAIASAPANPAFHSNQGLVLNQLRRPAEAEACLRTALRLQPAYPDAHNNLGIALSALGRLDEAEASYRAALRHQPNFPDALNNLGVALVALSRPAEAVASYREASRLRPDFADAHGNLGIALFAAGRPSEAEASYRQALRLRPDFRDALNNLGVVLSALGRPAEAEAVLGEAVRLAPDAPDAHSNLGVALCELCRSQEGEASVREALRLRPDYPDAHSNLGMALMDLRRLDEAEASCREALRLAPALADAHRNLASTLFLAGRYGEAWEEYEWRWKVADMAGGFRGFAAPLWSGEPIGDAAILLHAEQGLGDTLQFCRYASLIEPRATVVLEVQAPLVRLLSAMPGVAKVVARGEALPPFDWQCPILSLPRAFGASFGAAPYLAADPADAALWRERLAHLTGLKVGLVWAGEPKLGKPKLAAIDARRSMPLAAMAPLGEASGVSFVSLQKGASAAQAADPPPGLTLHDFTADLADFADTAALVESLDLVISVDTSVAHLAGALGKPVWLLNRYDTCWRWRLDGDDCPWYPTLRQFRQPALGDWASVMTQARDALHRLAAGDQGQLGPRRGGA